MTPRFLAPLALAATAWAADKPTDFSAVCVASAVKDATMQRVDVVSRCRLQDMADITQFNNRWRIVLDNADMSLPETADYIRAEMRQDGSLEFTVVLWGSIRVYPLDPALRSQMAASYKPGSFEVRPQNLKVSKQDDGSTEWLAWEGQNDTGWTARHEESLRGMGNAK